MTGKEKACFLYFSLRNTLEEEQKERKHPDEAMSLFFVFFSWNSISRITPISFLPGGHRL